MKKELLTRTECQVLRGLAIIGIFLHNYCHWLGLAVKENEYQYFQHNVDWLKEVCFSRPDEYLPIHLLSFFGHYGVPVFLFLSAYGLTRKYETVTVGKRVFVRYHFLKLFKMMVVGFVAFTILDAITPNPHTYAFVDVLGQLLMLNNVFPMPDKVIWPGPYWFFGLMLQLYVVYRLLLYRRHWAWTVALMSVCVLLQLLFNPEGEALNRYRYNFMGGMLPFGMGLLYARYGLTWMRRELSGGVWLLCTLLFIGLIAVFSNGMLLWTLAPAIVCIASVSAVKALSSFACAKPLVSLLCWMGKISAALFVCHPILRKVFIPISQRGDVYTGLLLYVVSSVCVAFLFRWLLQKMPNPALKSSQ